MNRRSALKRTMVVIGGTAISASALSSLLISCQAEPQLSFTPQFLSESEAQTLTAALDALIPTTDTPGALDAGIPAFIDQFAGGFMAAADQEQLKNGLAQMDTDSQEQFGKAFALLSTAQQEQLLNGYDQAAFGENREDTAQATFFRNFKRLSADAFCQSEIGATQFLQHELTPGVYTNCVQVEELNNTNWMMVR